MSRLKIMEDIHDLINSNPMESVEIAPIIEKYTSGIEFSNQASVRISIQGILRDLVKEGDIVYMDDNIKNITTAQYGAYLSSTGKIRSTPKYEKEKKNNANSASSVINIHAPVNQSVIGHNSGDININDSSLGFLDWILKNIWTIILGVVGSLIAAFLIWKLHLFT